MATEPNWTPHEAEALQDLAERLKLFADRGEKNPIVLALSVVADRHGFESVAHIERVLAPQLHALATRYAAAASSSPSRAEAEELERYRGGRSSSS